MKMKEWEQEMPGGHVESRGACQCSAMRLSGLPIPSWDTVSLTL